MADTYMADVSEFQTNVDAPTYLKRNKCIICRVHNGSRPDNMMPVRRDYLRAHPFTALGWYQYLVPGRSAADQAHEFIKVVGQLKTNEFAVLDLEEGRGDQVSRAQSWFDVVDHWANMRATLYAGESYLATNLGGAKRWAGRPIWVAAYRNREPTVPHILWQYSDSVPYAGITPARCDSSVHHGTASHFIYGVRHAAGGGGV